MIFDPNHGTGSTLVATVSDTERWAVDYEAIRKEREKDILEREMRDLGFGQRASVCG